MNAVAIEGNGCCLRIFTSCRSAQVVNTEPRPQLLNTISLKQTMAAL